MKTSKVLSTAALLLILTTFFGFAKGPNNLNKAVAPPKVQVSLDDIQGNTITLQQIFKVLEVRATEVSTSPESALSYTVNSYTFAIAPKKGQPFLIQVKGNKILNDIKKRFSNLQTGDLVIVGDVNATGPDGKAVKLAGITYSVK